MIIERITLGYWYPRTTLHLAELYDFLQKGESPLALNPSKLKKLREALTIETVQLVITYLEYIEIHASNGIDIKVFEDGLVTLSNDHQALTTDIKELTNYFERRFSPAIHYLFSLGAPVPKELAQIDTVLPYFIVTHGAKEADIEKLFRRLGSSPETTISDKGIDIYKAKQHYIVNTAKSFQNVDGLIETLIFFKEFKAQLHHYLNLHRTIWEEIAEIKEKRFIRGREVQDERMKLESYKKTIELIEGRINQMGIYMSSREAIVQKNGWEQVLTTVLASRYENLHHSLDYIRSLWTMTKQYLDSAIQIFNEVNALSTKNSVQALTVITSLGIVNMVINFLGTKQYPGFTEIGLYYLAILVAGTWVLNKLVTYVFQVMRYKINDIKLTKKF